MALYLTYVEGLLWHGLLLSAFDPCTLPVSRDCYRRPSTRASVVFAPYLYRGVGTSFQLLPGVQTTLPRLDAAAGFINHNAPAPLRHWTEQVRTSGGVAVCFWKKEWGGLTKNGGSGTMRVNEGGFGLAPYLCRGIVTATIR